MQTTRKWILSICSNTLQHTSRDIEQVSPCVHTTGKICWGLNIPKPQLHMKYPTRFYYYRPTSSRTANCFCRIAVATLSDLTIPLEITYISPYRLLRKSPTTASSVSRKKSSSAVLSVTTGFLSPTTQ